MRTLMHRETVSPPFSCQNSSITVKGIVGIFVLCMLFFGGLLVQDGYGYTEYSSTDVPKTIPDPGTTTSSLLITDTDTLTDLNVKLNITHSWDGDLDVYLIAPDGTRVELFTDVGGMDDNFTNTILDDEATTSITAGSAPFTGSYRPEGSLAVLDGKSISGTWKLEVTDDESLISGTLNSWSLLIETNGGGGDGVVTYHAVVCGIENYQGSLYDLNYCHEDADDLRNSLLGRSDWNSANINVLKYSVTKSQIQTAIQNMGSRADSDDICVFFFSGHGTAYWDVSPYDETDLLDEYLVTYNGIEYDPYWDEYYFDYDNMVRDDELGDWMDELPTNKYIVFLDACNSGGHIKGVGKVKGIGDLVPSKGDGFAADLIERIRAKDLDDNFCGVVVTACDDDEDCEERGSLQNSVFTYCLVEGMGGPADTAGNSNGRISAEECYYYVRPCALSYNPEQHAQMYDGHTGELEFLCEGECSPPTGVLASDGTYTSYVRITWDAVGIPCNYYRVYRATSSTGTKTALGTGCQTSTSYNDTTATPGITYYYWVKSAKDSSCSDASDFSSYNSGWRKLSPPTGVSATKGACSDEVCITWNSVSGASFYQVYRATSSTGTKTPISDWQTSTSYCDDTAEPGVTYYYWVKAAVSSSGYQASNYSAYDTGWLPTPPEAQDGTVTTLIDTPVLITLQATDEGCPDPPAALTYTIMSLPIYGDLNEPGVGLIIDPCTPLLDYGNQVEYIPDTGYEGQDSFTFKANDGGVPLRGGDSNEATVSINVTACIFFDDFPSPTLDTNNWPETSGTPTVDDTAGYEPNGPSPYSLHLEATDSVTSRMVDLYGCWSAQLNYWWKCVSTESGDDLYLDYWDGNEWQPLDTLPGGADTVWEPNSVELPADALHEEFRLRFRADCDSSSDEWYIDDVCIQCKSCIDHPFLHDEPNKTQGCCNTIYWDPVPDAIWYYAECANDANFANTVTGSGWISETNCTFTGLYLGQTYWYRVKATPQIRSWSQTSQAEFQTDTLIDTIATSGGDVVLTGGGSTIFQDDFEDGNYDGWINGTSSCIRQVTDETAAAGTTYSLTQIGSSNHREGVYYTLPSIMPDRLIFHVRTDSTDESGYVLLDGVNSSECAVFFYSGYGQLQVSQDTIYGTECELLTWYKVEFVFHWLTKTFDFYVDDELVADSTPFRNSASYINTIHLYNFRNAQAWWDEIEFSTGSGDITSTAIDLPADGNWVVVDFNTTTPADTELTVDILPAAGLTPIPGYENVPSGADLSGIGEPTIRLRANLSTTDVNNTPVLHDWSVSYTDPALACESDWSNVESSLQCDTLCDFDNNNEINFADFAILAGQWLQVPGSPSADIAPEVPDGFVDFLDLAVFVENWLLDLTCTVQN